MILLAVDYIQIIADIVAAILIFLNPIVSPLGWFMVNWMEIVLQYFPKDNLTVYIIIAVIILVLGLIVNIAWPGDKKPGFLVKAKELEEKVEDEAEEREEKVEELEEKIEVEEDEPVELDE